MTPKDQDIADALRLEEIEFIEAGRDAATANEATIKAMIADAARKGVAASGGRYKTELEIRFGGAGGLIEKAIAKRAQLGRKFPELLTPARLSELQQRLNRSLSAIVQSQHDRMARDRAGFMPAALEALNRAAEQMAARLSDTITHAIEKLTLEARLGVNEGQRAMTFNISNSTIANLNLGNVVGNLAASVNVLNEHGQTDLAREIKALTEALANSRDIPDDQRSDLLEHLSFVSREVALPPEQRNPAPLRSSIQTLQKGLTIAGQLAALWQPIEHVLKATGVLKP